MRSFLFFSLCSIACAANGPFQYGDGPTRWVTFNSNSTPETAEYTDGFKFTVKPESTIRMNVITQEAINPGTLPSNYKPLDDYAYIIKTNNPDIKLQAEMRIPFNRTLLALMKPGGSSPTTMLLIAKRPLNATSGQFLILNGASQVVNELPEDRVSIGGLTQLDGQYIILVGPPKKTAWASDVQAVVKGRELGEPQDAVIEPIKRDLEEGFRGGSSDAGLDSGSMDGLGSTKRQTRRDSEGGFSGVSSGSSGVDLDSGSLGEVGVETNITSKSTDPSMNVATSAASMLGGDSTAALAIAISIAVAIVYI